MDRERIVQELIDSCVLEVINRGDLLVLTDDFVTDIQEYRTRFESLPRDAIRAEMLQPDGDEYDLNAVFEGFSDDMSVLAEYHALSECTDELTQSERLQVLQVLDQFRETSSTDGVPDGFIPVQGNRLSSLVKLTPAALVYVWRHDCEPCELVKEDLEVLIETPLEDIALFAVYGPKWASELRGVFDVIGAPTVLFFLDGKVDTRLQGPNPRRALETEIDIIKSSVTNAS